MYTLLHDDVIKWKHFPRYLPFVRGNSPVTGGFPAQRPVTRSFDVFLDLRRNKRLSKQLWGWWFETLSRPLWRHCNEQRIDVDRVPHTLWRAEIRSGLMDFRIHDADDDVTKSATNPFDIKQST